MKSFFSNFKCFDAPGGCGWSDLSFFFSDILKSLFVIGLFVAACMVSYAGWVLLIGQGNPASRSKAKAIFKSIVIGCILLFGAYYVVDLILTKVGLSEDYRKGFVQPSR